MKLEFQFIYLCSNNSSTENDVKICIDKVWSTIVSYIAHMEILFIWLIILHYSNEKTNL